MTPKEKQPIGDLLKWLWKEPWFQRALLLGVEWVAKKIIKAVENRKKKLNKKKDGSS